MSMKNFNDTIGSRTRDLSNCGTVPQPTALPRAPHFTFTFTFSPRMDSLKEKIYSSARPLNADQELRQRLIKFHPLGTWRFEKSPIKRLLKDVGDCVD
jgi:hypothetical protein